MLRSLIACLLFACGGGSAKSTTAPTKTCEPGRCLEDFAAKVQEHRATARACYDAKPTPEGGRVIINFEIDPTGKVVDASQSVKDEQIQDREIVACIIDVIKEIQFAASAAGKTTKAYHTFEFSPRK